MDSPTLSAPITTPPPPVPTRILPTFLTVLLLLTLTVTGALAYQNWQLNQRLNALSATPTPTPSLTPTPTTDPTVNWNTYSNSTIGISFKYPPEWQYTESKTLNNVSFNTKIASQEKRENQALDFVFEALLEDPRNYTQWVNTPDQTQSLGLEQINNLSFEKYVVTDMYYSLNYIYKSPDGKIVRFMIWPYNAHDATRFPVSLKDTVNQILSTFKFLNKADEGTLQATVMRSPTCAGAQSPGETCEAPYANGTFKIIRLPGNEVVQTATTDKNGKFAISLAVGTYKLQSSTGGVDKFGRIGGIGKMIDNPDFTINSGKTTTQQFDIDTGIR